MSLEDGRIKVTINTLVFRKWWVDYVNDSTRYVYVDGVCADQIGTVQYIRAYWVMPQDCHAICFLSKVRLGSILKMTSVHCTIETTEDFHFIWRPKIAGEPIVCIGMKHPAFSVVPSTNLETDLLSTLRDSLKKFVPDEEIYDQFQTEVQRKNALANASLDK